MLDDVGVMGLLPGLAVATGPWATQLPPTLLGEATSSPLGSMSSNDMLISSVAEFGLVAVKTSEAVPFRGMLAAAKLLASLRGATTRRADTVKVPVLLLAPAPLSKEELGPVVVFFRPPVLTAAPT